jgi:hypothetical protein
MTTDQTVSVRRDTWLALWAVVVKAEAYLLEGNNMARNQLDLAIQNANKEAARDRQTE